MAELKKNLNAELKEKKNPKPVVVTHSGTFHADEVFAVAVLSIIYKGNIEIIRTRDEDVIKIGDYVVDVGREYNPEKNKFDHHQEGGAGERPNGIPYASFGLVWRHFGNDITGSSEITQRIDEELVQPIDALDNGLPLSNQENKEIKELTVSGVIRLLNPNWDEEVEKDIAFKKALKIAEITLSRIISKLKAQTKAKKFIIDAYNRSKDKRIVVLDQQYSWKDTIRQFSEPLFVIFPGHSDDKWIVHTVRREKSSFESRKLFPEEWGGKERKELVKITGIPGIRFCHRGLFICAVDTKDEAITLAQMALENNKNL